MGGAIYSTNPRTGWNASCWQGRVQTLLRNHELVEVRMDRSSRTASRTLGLELELIAMSRLNDRLWCDLEASRQAEAALRLSEARFRGVFENAREGIYQRTPAGRYLVVNPAMARMFGYDSPSAMIDSLAGSNLELHIDRAVHDHFRQQLEEKGAVSGLEYQVRRKDGKVIWVSEFARIVRDARGAVAYYEGTVYDITHRKETQEQRGRPEAPAGQLWRVD